MSIRIRVLDEISELFAKELEAVENSSNEGSVDLEVEFLESEKHLKNYNPKIFSAKALMNFDDSSFFVGYHNNYKYLLTNPFLPGPVKLLLIKKRKPPLTGIYFTPERVAQSILSYRLFWYVFHLALQKKEATFLHAGVYDSGNGAAALTGTGGSGKTSCLFHILSRNRSYKYLSEDFGVIDAEGFAHYNPKFVSIYHSDTRQKLLKQYVENNLSVTKKAGWRSDYLLLGKNPRIKVPPRDLLGSRRIIEKSRLRRVYYMIRGNFNEVSISPLSINELVERSLNVTYREMKFLIEISRLISANMPGEMNFLSPEQIIHRNSQVYYKAFEDVELHTVLIPKESGPEEVAEAIEGA